MHRTVGALATVDLIAIPGVGESVHVGGALQVHERYVVRELDASGQCFGFAGRVNALILRHEVHGGYPAREYRALTVSHRDLQGKRFAALDSFGSLQNLFLT